MCAQCGCNKNIIGNIGNPDGKQDKPEGGYKGVGGSK
jgi:hypothetical protein